jgi:hypothetical protein
MLLIVAIGVVLFIVVMILKAKSSKSRVATTFHQEDDHGNHDESVKEVPGENTKVFYYKKKYGIGTAVNIVPNYFPNGSALVITSDGNRQRKKMKHCFV